MTAGQVDRMIASAERGDLKVSPSGAMAMAAKLYADRRYVQAARVCRQVITARPIDADAHNILGVTLRALGESGSAIKALETAIAINPSVASYHANLGEILRQQGRLDDAERHLQIAIKLDNHNAQALNNLGIVHFEREQWDNAISRYRQALDIRPDLSEAWNNLGNALRKTSQKDEALNAYLRALTYREAYPEAYYNLGTMLIEQERLEEAERALCKAIALNACYVEALTGLANLLHSQGRTSEALRMLGDALRVDGSNQQALLLTARIQNGRSNYAPAEKACRRVLAAAPDHVEAGLILAHILHETDRFDEALAILAKFSNADDAPAEALSMYGIALKSLGRFDEAREQLLGAMAKSEKSVGIIANLADLVDFRQEEALFLKLKTAVSSMNEARAEEAVALHFAYAKALEDRGQNAKALQHYKAGGKLRRETLAYNEAETAHFFEQIKEVFSRELLMNPPFPGLDDERPVFIVGMPRSGSTLVEQIISSHRDVHGAGEVKHFSRAVAKLRDRFPSLPKYPHMIDRMDKDQYRVLASAYLEPLVAGREGASRISDKLLTNYYFVGLIHLLFPKARIIHAVRDPIDTCLSAFTKHFKDDMPYSYDLEELGRYYCRYKDLMRHWAEVLPPGVMLTVNYESLVKDTEAEVRRLLDFLSVEWDEQCLSFYRSKRPVRTASVTQVRRPIYTTSVQRSKKYGKGLQPLVEALGARGK